MPSIPGDVEATAVKTNGAATKSLDLLKDAKHNEFEAKVDDYSTKAGITTQMVEELNQLALEVVDEKEHHDPEWDRERKRKLQRSVRNLKGTMNRQQIRRGEGYQLTGCLLLLPESVHPHVAFVGGYVRRASLAAIEHWFFDQFIMGCILANCVFLALANPSSDEEPEYQQVASMVFLIIFTLECLFKSVALGSMYLEDNWNWLDLVVVVEGWVSALSAGGSVLGGLKTLRILRPLRVANRLPALKTIINALLASLPAIFDTFVVFFFFLVICTLICVMLWSGTFHFRCKDEVTGEWVDEEALCFPGPGQGDDDENQDDDGSVDSGGCSGLSFLDQPYTCERGETCSEFSSTPEGNHLNFDNVALGFLALFAATTMEGWANTLYYTQDVMTPNTFAVFLAIIVIGNFTIINLMIAAILVHLDKQQSLQSQDQVEREMATGRGEEARLKYEEQKFVDAIKEEERLHALACEEALAAGREPPTPPRALRSLRRRRSSLRGKEVGDVEFEEPHSFFETVENAAWAILKKGVSLCYDGVPRVQTKGHWAFELRWWVLDDASPFSFFIQLCIVFNLIVLAMDGHGISGTTSDFLSASNLVLTGVFVLEMGLKLAVAGVPEYCASAWNLFDGVIVTGSVIELALDDGVSFSGGDDEGSGGGSSLGALRVVRMLRLMRVARLARLANKSKVLNHAVTTVTGLIVKSSRKMFPVLLLLILFMFIFTILGMQLFGSVATGDDFIRFDNFYVAFVQCFYVITGEAWVDIMYVTMATKVGAWSAIYFVVMVIVGTFILLNLILAAVLAESLPEKSNVEQGLKKFNLCYDLYKFRSMWDRWKWATDQAMAALEKKEALELWSSAARSHPGGATELLQLAQGLGVSSDVCKVLESNLRRLSRDRSRRNVHGVQIIAATSDSSLGARPHSRRSSSRSPTAAVAAGSARREHQSHLPQKAHSGSQELESAKGGAEWAEVVAARERLRLRVARPGDEQLATRLSEPTSPPLLNAASPPSSLGASHSVDGSGRHKPSSCSGGGSGDVGVGGGAPSTTMSDEDAQDVLSNSMCVHTGTSFDQIKRTALAKSRHTKLIGVALETLAAVTIQTQARGFIVRKSLRKSFDAASSQQKKSRLGVHTDGERRDTTASFDKFRSSALATGRHRKLIGVALETLAAVTIQTQARGFIARKKHSYPTGSKSSEAGSTVATATPRQDSSTSFFSRGIFSSSKQVPSSQETRDELCTQDDVDDGKVDDEEDEEEEEEEEEEVFDAGTWYDLSRVLAVVDDFARLLKVDTPTSGAPGAESDPGGGMALLKSFEAHPTYLEHAQSVRALMLESEASDEEGDDNKRAQYCQQGPKNDIEAHMPKNEHQHHHDHHHHPLTPTVGGGPAKRRRTSSGGLTTPTSSLLPHRGCYLSVTFEDPLRPRWMAYRKWSLAIATHALFHDAIMLAIALSCITMVINSDDGGEDTFGLWDGVDSVCAFLFLVEALLKLGATELYKKDEDVLYGHEPVTGPLAYLADPWNRLDGAIVLSSILAPVFASQRELETGSAICAVVRACRPLRVINHIDSLKDTVVLLYKSTLALSSIAVFLAFASVAYAVVGMQLFKGLYWYCDESDDLLGDESYLAAVGGAFPPNTYRYGEPLKVPSADGKSMVVDPDGRLAVRPCEGTFLDTEGVEREALGQWTNPTFHFDDFGSALLSVFVLSTEGWAEIIWSGLAATNIDYSGEPYANDNPLVIPFFAFAVSFFGLYLMNLFVGVVFDEYSVAKAAASQGHFDELVFINRAMGERLSRKEDQDWSQFKGRLATEKPHRYITRPHVWWRKRCAALVESHYFHNAVLMVIGLNAIALAVTHRDQPDSMTEFLEWTNVAFALVFCVEAILMLVGLGAAAYFADSVNVFDFVVTAVSLLDSMLFVTNTCMEVDSAFLRFVRSMRVFRLMRLVFVIKGCEDIYLACRYAFQRLVNVCLLLLILIFFFANVGWVFFHGFSDSYGSRYANFQSIGGAMQLLFVLMTGDAWTDTFGAMVEKKPEKFSLVMMYFLVYLVVQYMVMVNLFVMVVCEAFDVLSVESRKVVEKMVPRFKVAWAQVDPDAHGFIAPDQVEKFLRVLPGPFGVPFLPKQPHQPPPQPLASSNKASVSPSAWAASLNSSSMSSSLSSPSSSPSINDDASTAAAKAQHANFRRLAAKAEYVRSSCADARKKRAHVQKMRGSSRSSSHGSHLTLNMRIGRRHGGRVAPQPDADSCYFTDVLCTVVAMWLSEYGHMPVPGVSNTMKELAASIRIADMFRRYTVRFRKAKEAERVRRLSLQSTIPATAEESHRNTAQRAAVPVFSMEVFKGHGAARAEKASHEQKGDDDNDGHKKTTTSNHHVWSHLPSWKGRAHGSKGAAEEPHPLPEAPPPPHKRRMSVTLPETAEARTGSMDPEPSEATALRSPARAAEEGLAGQSSGQAIAGPPPVGAGAQPHAEEGSNLSTQRPAVSTRLSVTRLPGSSSTRVFTAAAADDDTPTGAAQASGGGELRPAVPRLLQPLGSPGCASASVESGLSVFHNRGEVKEFDPGGSGQANQQNSEGEREAVKAPGGVDEEPPAALTSLPPGWVQAWSNAYETHFYHNEENGLSSWKTPRTENGEEVEAGLRQGSTAPNGKLVVVSSAAQRD